MTPVKSVYIRIPKTGSTSLVKVFSAYRQVRFQKRDKLIAVSKSNYLARKHRDALGRDEWRNSFSFTFVRNPFDRCVSAWRFLEPDKPFDAFLDKLDMLSRDHRERFDFFSWHCCQQSPHVLDEQGDIMVDFIGRFESLQEDFERICDHLSLEVETLPHYKRTRRGHYSEYYDEARREQVVELYRQDFEKLNYSTEIESPTG